MADRRVTPTGKDDDGDITKLCQTGATWSPRSKSDAIDDIDNKIHTYYVKEGGLPRVDVHIYTLGSKKHLRTTADSKSANNLDNLPDC